MPLQATSGAASYDAFGGGVAAVPNYIEDVFSTWLYTGTGSTQTITNGIDLSTYGGMVWTKNRNATQGNAVFDTVRGNTKYLLTQTTDAQQTSTDDITGFLSTGYTLGNNATTGNTNYGTYTYASWTFREQPKFFDVVTWTGDASGNRTLSHTLASTPGCIIIKATNAVDDWYVYHTSLGTGKWLYLNTTSAEQTGSIVTAVSSTTFTVSQSNGFNTNGRTYVAYLFAHNAGGFGLTGTDNVISCGSYVGNSTTPPTINLGWEPQWILLKDASASGADARFNWTIVDNMRGLVAGRTSDQAQLFANTSDAEDSGTFAQVAGITATGFVAGGQRNTTGNTYIYIAIRRGPMRTPTTGTSVFDPETATASTGTSRTIGFPADMSFGKARTITASNLINDRLRGYANSNTTAPALFTNLTSAEDVSGTSANVYNVWNTTALDGAYFNNLSTVWYHFRRASGFFDVVCDTGTGSVRTVAHNLGVAPEFIIRKMRGGVAGWYCYHSALGNTDAIRINSTSATASDVGYWNNTTPTSTQFTVGTSGDTNQNTATFVTYLFASCPGVSKVFNYTGNGSSQTINCGFTGGARFVMIKRTDSTGDWYVWDTARGIVANNDPHLSLNTTAAEVTTNDTIDTDSTGFVVNQVSATNVNVNGASYIGLAIA